MINKNEIIENKRQILKKIINFQKHRKLFDFYDTQIAEKCFDVTKDQSILDIQVSLNYTKINKEAFNEIIDNFLKKAHQKTFFEKNHIREIIKATGNQLFKIETIATHTKFLSLANKIKSVSKENKYLTHDFLLLKLVDNIIVQLKNSTLKNIYKNIKKDIIYSLLNKDYLPEKKEEVKYCYCFVDRIVSACVNKEITLNNFIDLGQKILKLADYNLDILWKTVMAINYLSFNDLFDDSVELRKFKRYTLKIIKNKLDTEVFTKKDILENLFKILASEVYKKESFYYLFDVLQNQITKQEKDKMFYLTLCEYLIYYNTRRDIFTHRFIRNDFANFLHNLILNETSAIVQERLFIIYIELFHTAIFYIFMKKDLLENILLLLNNMNKNKQNISKQRFYKYCDLIDFICSYNDDIINYKRIEKICENFEDKDKILKRFTLTKKASNL